MNYDNPELRDLLAGHYVLGHMPSRARALFERLLLSRPDYSRAVVAWEERLSPMLHATTPQRPPRRVWRRLRRRIERETSAPSRRPWFGQFGTGGLTWAGVATAAFLVVLGLYLAQPAVTPPAPPSQYAVISTQQGAPRWVITVSDKKMHMRTAGRAAPPSGKSYELWMLPGGEAHPVSLGVLPVSGEASEKLTPAMLKTLKSSKALAVSIEPEGGSPTGLPTGPVVYTAPIASI